MQDALQPVGVGRSCSPGDLIAARRIHLAKICLVVAVLGRDADRENGEGRTRGRAAGSASVQAVNKDKMRRPGLGLTDVGAALGSAKWMDGWMG